jgi:Ca2+-binding RTX toxin-like protein
MASARLVLLVALALVLLAIPATGQAAPSCAEGPQTEGTTIVGTPCADTIRLPRNVTTVLGEGGDDVLYGQRGNDSLFGGEGNDRLYGGVGDDRLRGGPGNDRLFGGFGADSLDGEAGDDLARGDATVDAIGDSGGGTDTLSFATGATPGFPNDDSSFFTDAGFPATAEGRGVYVDLGDDFANDGLAPSGGGVDKPLEPSDDLPEPSKDFSDFETVIGTPFDDYIVGTSGAETFYGGGGADLIDGGGGGDVAHGGADGDGCVGVATDDCENHSEDIDPRDPGAIAVGAMAPGSSAGPALYMDGSDEADRVTVSYAAGVVTFTLGAGSQGQLEAGSAGGCAAPSGGTVACPVSEPPDSILLAGLEEDDILLAPSLPETVAVVLLGNEGDDELKGGETEDVLIDGAGDDTVSGAGRDDALPNNGGADQLDAGAGEDLFISNAICDGDVLNAGADRDNANWANFGTAISIDMAQQRAGLIGPAGQPQCPSAAELTTLQGLEDVEGTGAGDNLVGDSGPNQLLGRGGPDNMLSGAGDDLILANSGDSDPIVDCGEGFDTALIDFSPAFTDGPPVGCESVEERAKDSFRPPDTPPNPDPEPETQPPQPPPPPEPKKPKQPRDRTPATRLGRHPTAQLFTAKSRRRVAFTFSASEPGSTFRCRIDRKPYRPCRSPRAYLVGPGRHAFGVFAIDAAGNRDRSPAVFRFRVRS